MENMLNLKYIGIMDDEEEFFPLYNDASQNNTTLCPKNQETLDVLAKENDGIINDCLYHLRQGKKMILGKMLTTKESYTTLMNSILSRIENLALEGNYSNPTSPDCQTFYGTLADMVENEIPIENIKAKYESVSDYEFKPFLLQIYAQN